MPSLGPYVAFLTLCLVYGSSYAWISTFLHDASPAVFSFLRMFFALLAILCIFFYSYSAIPGERAAVHGEVGQRRKAGEWRQCRER
jgi:apolipoprotein N-acyltransferase